MAPKEPKEIYMRENKAVQNTAEDYTYYNIINWYDDETGEGEEILETIAAVSEIHAELILRDRINYRKYPKGACLEKIGGVA